MISIVTVCFNSQATITDTIESVLNQSINGYEYIIIDGFSNDNTIKIIKSYEDKFKNKNISFKWISEPDSGIYQAWNKGIKISQGNWLGFVGADDILTKEYVEIYSNFIKKNKNLEYISSIVHVIKNNRIIRIIDKGWNWNKFKKNMDVGHVGSLHNIKLYKRLGLYDEKLSIVGDYELLLRAKNTLKADYIDKLTVNMRAGGISSNNLYCVLKEIRFIKLKHKTVSKIQANFDLVIMYLKALINNLIK